MKTNLAPSGFEMNYTDPNSGINLPNAWVQMTNILYVPASYCLIVYDIYADQGSYQTGKSPVFPNNRLQSNFGEESWISYFDPSVMDMANHDIQNDSLTFLQLSLVDQD